MRIAYISSAIIPSRTANSVHIMRICQAFTKNGHQVTLFAPDVQGQYENNITDEYAFYGVDKCFDVVKLPWVRIKGRGYMYGLNAALRAKKTVPDLVYCRNTTGCFFSALSGLPVIFESHSPVGEEGHLCRWMFSDILKSPRLKRLVVITQALKEHYERHYPQISVKIMVSPDGADPVPEGVRPIELPNKRSRFQVGYVGHLYQGRGIDLIISLSAACSWADFHIVGGAPEDIEYWRTQSSRQGNIFFHGFLPPSKAEQFRISFDALLAPYQGKVSIAGGVGNTAQWMSPLKIFEYMAASKSIIASDLPVLREVLHHEHNALLCPPDEVDAWKKALERLRDDRPLRQTLSSKAHDDFLQHYTWESRAAFILSNL